MERFSRWKKIYLKIACFLIGYEYSLISECSVLSIKNLKKYFTAVIVIAIIWFIIGFNFSQTYIKLNLIKSIIGGLIASIIIIKIERQIILTIEKSRWIFVMRLSLGIVIAAIGAAIIDQIIFKDDIEKAKLEDDQKEVARLVPLKTKELEEELNRFKENIEKLNSEREELVRTINEKPFVENRTTIREYGIDTTKKRRFEKGGSEQITQVINPNIERVKLLEKEIQDFQNKMSETNQKKNKRKTRS